MSDKCQMIKTFAERNNNYNKCMQYALNKKILSNLSDKERIDCANKYCKKPVKPAMKTAAYNFECGRVDLSAGVF